jgi:hypothetical protein
VHVAIDVAVIATEYFPAGQSVQVCASAPEYDPARQVSTRTLVGVRAVTVALVIAFAPPDVLTWAISVVSVRDASALLRLYVLAVCCCAMIDTGRDARPMIMIHASLDIMPR